MDGSQEQTVVEGDTLLLRARAINAAGDTVPDAAIVWELLEVDTGQVGFTLDTLTGLVTARSPGSGRVRARVGTLASGVITVIVVPAPDSIAAAGPQQVAMGASDGAEAFLLVTRFPVLPFESWPSSRALRQSAGDARAGGKR